MTSSVANQRHSPRAILPTTSSSQRSSGVFHTKTSQALPAGALRAAGRHLPRLPLFHPLWGHRLPRLLHRRLHAPHRPEPLSSTISPPRSSCRTSSSRPCPEPALFFAPPFAALPFALSLFSPTTDAFWVLLGSQPRAASPRRRDHAASPATLSPRAGRPCPACFFSRSSPRASPWSWGSSRSSCCSFLPSFVLIQSAPAHARRPRASLSRSSSSSSFSRSRFSFSSGASGDSSSAFSPDQRCSPRSPSSSSACASVRSISALLLAPSGPLDADLNRNHERVRRPHAQPLRPLRHRHPTPASLPRPRRRGCLQSHRLGAFRRASLPLALLISLGTGLYLFPCDLTLLLLPLSLLSNRLFAEDSTIRQRDQPRPRKVRASPGFKTSAAQFFSAPSAPSSSVRRSSRSSSTTSSSSSRSPFSRSPSAPTTGPRSRSPAIPNS